MTHVPAGESLVRLSVELPAGVVIKTRSVMPTLEYLGSLAHSLLRTQHSTEYRGTTPVLLELEFPERLRASVDDALARLRTVGRANPSKESP